MSRVSPPSYGSHLIDGFTVGNFKNPLYMGTPDSFGYKGYLGLRCLPVYPFFITPAANDPTGIANPQIVDTAYATLKSPIMTLDVERSVSATGVAGTAAVTVEVWGTDMYGQTLSSQITFTGGATTLSTTKTFKTVTAIYVTGDSQDTLSFGWSNIFGMPIVVQSFAQIISGYWNNTLVVSANFTNADQNPGSATTNSVRGTITAPAPDPGAGISLVVYISPMMIGTPAAYQTDEQFLGVTQFASPLP